MNNENSGVVEDGQKEAPLNDSINSTPTNRQVADNNGSQGPKPPDSKTFQLQMDEVVGRIRVTEEKLKSLEKQVLASGCKINKSASPIDKEKLHEELQDLRSQREKVIEERKQCDVELKGLNVQVQKKNDACTKRQAAVRYKSEARIDEAVRRLEHQMQAQQLKLSEEKRIVAEIDTLKRSKRSLNEYLVLKQQVDQMRNKQKHLRSQRDACVKRINGLKAKEEKVKNLLDSGDSRAEKKEAQIEQPEHLSPLLESLKKELNVLHNKKKELKAKFSKEKSDYFSAMREMKTHKQREEATRRKNEKQTMMKAVVSSRATRQLYEKEKSICDTLISHLEKLHTSLVHLPEVQGAASTDKEPLVSVSASADFSSCGEGMFLRRKSDADDLVGAFAGVHRTSRRGSRKGRRSSTKEAPRKLNLHPEVVEHLLTLGLSPPSTAADLPKVLEELHGKKEFYKNAPSSSSMWALASNDPMSPINEEAAPEFPTKFEEKDASKATEASVKTESTVEKVEDKEGGEHLHDIVSQLSSTEGDEVSCSKNCDEVNIESAEDLNSLVSERDKNVSEIEKAELEKSAASEPSTDQPVASGNSDESVEGIGNHKLTHTTKEPIPVVLSPSGDDLCDSNKVVKNISDFKNCSPVMKEKHESSTKDQMLSRTEKTDLASRENISTPLLQNSTSAEHPNFTSSSPHTTKLALDQNGLEAAYEKNSLKEGHNIVKIQCEKCRA